MKTQSLSLRATRSFATSVEPLEARIAPATITLFGTAANDSLLVFATGPDSGSYQLNGGATVPFAGVTHFEFHGGDGDDLLAIVNQNGSVFAPVNGIVFAGDNQSTASGNFLLVVNGGGTTFTQSWTVGATPDTGTLSMTNGAVSQVIEYSGLESIVTTAPAATLTVTANNGDNAITYGAGTGSRGLVSVDGFATLEFANKDNLTINALAGTDTINLNNPTTPDGATPGGLKAIAVNGGDPTEGDVLIVNGIAGQLDNLRHDPTSVHAGTIINDNAPQPTVNYTGIEKLKLVVQEQDGDSVRGDGTIGNDRFEFFPGATRDSGTIRGTMDENNATGNGPFAYTETEYSGAAADVNDIDFNFFGPGGTDTMEFNGSFNADVLGVGTGEAGGVQISDTINGDLVFRAELFNFANVLVRGHEGGDTFNVSPVFVATAVTLDGDEGANVLNFTTFTATTTLNLATAALSVTANNPFLFANFDNVALNAVGTSSLIMAGTTLDDTISIAPGATGAGSFSVAGSGVLALQHMAFTYSGEGTFTVNGGGGFDVLGISGNEGNDLIASTASVVTATRPGSASAITIGTGLERLDVFGLGGNDRVDLSAFSSFGTRILGGDGDDVLIGSTQDDLIDGGAGKDVLRGGAGHNTLLNNGPFGFTSSTAYDVSKLPSAVVATNLNGDAFSDLVVVNRGTGTVSVLLGTATGRFQDPVSFTTGGLQPNSVAVGDFDGDGRLDLAVANGGSKNIGILIGDGSGSFAAATKVAVGKTVLGIQTAKLDNDAIFDLAVISGTKVLELTGVGNGTFNPARSFATGGVKPVALAIADFNQDGLNDIATANAGSASVSVLHGSATGFDAPVKFKVGVQPSALVAGDFDGDGKLDLAVTNKVSKFVSILRGNGNLVGAQFQRQLKVANPGKNSPSSIAAADLNGDGVLDLAIANSASGTFRVFLGIGNGLFTAPADFSLGGDPKTKASALAIGDFDGDGTSDIAVAGLGTGDVSVALQVVG